MKPPRLRLALLLALAGACWAGPALAHDINIATFEVRRWGALWTLVIDSPELAFERALSGEIEDAPDAGASRQKREEAIIAYVKEVVHLQADGGRLIALGEGAIRLDSHQTDLRFVLEGAPERWRHLIVHIDAFSDNPAQQNVFRLHHDRGVETRVLTAANQFTATFDLETGEAAAKPSN